MATAKRPQMVIPEDPFGPLGEFELKGRPPESSSCGEMDRYWRAAPRIAVAGSPRARSQGMDTARRNTEMLVSHSGPVVSRLAFGIDTVAREMPMTIGGQRMGGLGTSLDRYAVPRNQGFQDAIRDRRLLPSQSAAPW